MATLGICIPATTRATIATPTVAMLAYLVSMMKGYDDPRWVTMIQIMDNDGKYHPNEKWHLKK